MIVDEEAVLDYLEHFGVKGMHWGVRKSRTRVTSEGKKQPQQKTYRQQQERFKKTKVALDVAAVGVAGLLLVSAIRSKQGTRKMSSLPKPSSNTKDIASLFGQVGNIRYADVRTGFAAGPSGTTAVTKRMRVA